METTNSDTMSVEPSFTGERVIPGKVDPDLFNEHLARYVYARGFCSHKRVLDTGCGVGYGCCHLAETAHSVVGIDNDIGAIRYARGHHSRLNVEYLVGDCQALPFQSETFDVVTSFELIEHLPDVEGYLAEVQRVLKPQGVFVVSTPNRPVYAEHRRGDANPFHIREWDFNEFASLLRRYFRFVQVFGESHLPSVGILAPAKSAKLSAVLDARPAVEAADYFVCVCSQETQSAGEMIFAAPSANVLLERERHIQALSSQLAEREQYLARLQAEFDEKALWANRLNAQLAEAESRLSVTVSKATRWKRTLVLSTLAPVDWIAGCAVLAAELVARLLRATGRRSAPMVGPADPTRCSIIVLSWEGKELLAECLPALLKAVRFHGGNHEVIVLDNGSTDGTSEYVRKHFPEVRVVRSERNTFYAGGNNLGVEVAKNDIVFLLNNDMIVQENFLRPLLEGFQDPGVFAVASQVFMADPNKRREETGKTRASFNGCDLDWAHDPILPSDEQRGFVPVFWGHGGAVALDRQKFRWLGGLDTLFDPFYVEDADLSYRAWKVGWRCLLAVSSHVVHKHRGSTSRFGSRLINQITRRNQYLFIWKNFGDLSKLAKHFLRSWRRRIQHAGAPGTGIRLEARAFLGAVERLPAVLMRRLRQARSVVRSDEEIFRCIRAAQADAVRESELDFESGDCAEQLGEGWYPREQSGGKHFRWMSERASVFLRAPGETADLLVRGHVPASSASDGSSLVLYVECHGRDQRFRLRAGPFERQWRVNDLPPGTPVSVQLAVSRTHTNALDQRTLGVAVERIALSAPASARNGDHDDKLHPPVSIKDAAPPARHGTAGQRRILMVCAYLPCQGIHGGGNMMFHLIRLLSRRHRLTVLAFYERDEEQQQISRLAPFCERLDAIYRGQSFEASNPLGLIPPEIANEFYHRGMSDLVAQQLKTQKFDLMQCEYLQTAHFANIDPKVPAILTSHELQSLSYARRYRALPWRASRKFSALFSWMRMLNYEERLLHRFAAVVVLTEREREFLARYAPGVRVFQRPMGVDSEFFRPSLPIRSTASVVFVGNFRHPPNVTGAAWFLDQVWPRVRARRPEAQACIVGGHPTPPLLARNGREGVAVTGFVEDVRPYLDRAAVFVAPIFDGAGLRTKVLEAWAMQKPVVGTRLAFEGLTDCDGEVCRMAEDPETFANHICELLENTELSRRMGTAARQLVVSKFSWEAFVSLYDRIYEEILGPAIPEAPHVLAAASGGET